MIILQKENLRDLKEIIVRFEAIIKVCGSQQDAKTKREISTIVEEIEVFAFNMKQLIK